MLKDTGNIIKPKSHLKSCWEKEAGRIFFTALELQTSVRFPEDEGKVMK